MGDEEKRIFRGGSTTYFWASRFFNPDLQKDVAQLYSYVRIVDDLVDTTKPDLRSVRAMERMRKGGSVTGLSVEQRMVTSNIIELTKRYGFDERWLAAFNQAMVWDAQRRVYRTIEDTNKYMYGSAEVIGLMMCKLLGLDVCTCHSIGQINDHTLPKRRACRITATARLQGRAMQYINFLRDIPEDVSLGRQYFPANELGRYKLGDISEDSARSNQAEFGSWYRRQLERYEQWQKLAGQGFTYIPRTQRVAIKTAVSGYNWTARRLRKRPLSVYDHVYKPSKTQLLLWGIGHAIWG